MDENYGEGSAREHAALQPRFYGCALILARSFARIHETNLKVFTQRPYPKFNPSSNLPQKQGVLPLWFANKDDYSRIGAGDTVETYGLEELLNGVPGTEISVKVTKRDGSTFNTPTKHTLSSDQLNWLRAGSALNYIRSQLS